MAVLHRVQQGLPSASTRPCTRALAAASIKAFKHAVCTTNASSQVVRARCRASAQSSDSPSAPMNMTALEKRFREAYTMSQVYVKDRPAPIPISEYENKRRQRELEEISAAGRKRGVSSEVIKANLAQVEQLLPGLINMHKAKASDWVLIIKDVNVLMTKVLVIKDMFPKANLQKVLQSQPKLLLKSEAELRRDGEQVRQMLAAAPEPDTIIECVPDLINPVNLVRSLAYIKSSFNGADPVEILSKHPDVLLNMGEASIEDSAEYGELSTKD